MCAKWARPSHAGAKPTSRPYGNCVRARRIEEAMTTVTAPSARKLGSQRLGTSSAVCPTAMSDPQKTIRRSMRQIQWRDLPLGARRDEQMLSFQNRPTFRPTPPVFRRISHLISLGNSWVRRSPPLHRPENSSDRSRACEGRRLMTRRVRSVTRRRRAASSSVASPLFQRSNSAFMERCAYLGAAREHKGNASLSDGGKSTTNGGSGNRVDRDRRMVTD